MIYAPIDLAVGLSQQLRKRGHSVDYYGPNTTEIENVHVETLNLRPLAINNAEFQDLLNKSELLNHYVPDLWDRYLAEEMFRRARQGEYDILHFQHPEIALSLARRYRSVPVVYTLNDPVYPWYKEIFELYASPNQHFVSISDNQRRDAPDLNYAATVYNGIDMEEFSFSADHEDYLLFTGRIVPEKGVKEAIQIAQATNHRLLIIGPVYPTSQGYFDAYIKPHLNDRILYLGYIEREKMWTYYQKAKAVLMPIQWEEPFGLTTIEAMACGTPAIAIARGSMPEIIKDGKTGFLVDSVGKMIEAVKHVNKIDRRECREHVKANFSLRQMADGYESVYRDILLSTAPASRLQRKVRGTVHRGLGRTHKVMRRMNLP